MSIHHDQTDHANSAHAADVTSHGDQGGGHDRHQGHVPEMFRDRLLVSLVLTGPILYFSSKSKNGSPTNRSRFPAMV